MGNLVTVTFRMMGEVEKYTIEELHRLVSEFLKKHDNPDSEAYITVAKSSPIRSHVLTEQERESVTANRAQIITPRPPRY